MFLKVFVFLSIVYLCLTDSLPPFIKLCPRTTPIEIEKCVLNQSETVIKTLKDGYPPFSIPPIDPLVIPQLDIPLSDDFVVKMKNLKIRGLAGTKLTRYLPEIRNDLVSSLKISLIMPKLLLSGQYEMKGFILIMDIDAAGLANMEITGLQADLKVNLREDIRDGVKYYQILDDFDIDIKFDQVWTNFENLVPDKEMNDSLNKLMNDNYEVLFQMLKPGIVNTVRKISRGVILQLMNVPAENFHP